MGRQLLAGTLTMNALLVLSIFISQSLGQASAECPEPTIGNCSATDYRCDLGFTAGCWMGSFCMPEGSICPMICNTPAPSNCSAGEIVCDMGSYDGCWGRLLPATGLSLSSCLQRPRSFSMSGVRSCLRHGISHGCWNGDYCAANGTVCPPVCHDPMPSQCKEGELTCDMGHYNGCWFGDFCHEDKNGFQCPPVCNWPAHSVCQDGEILCDMGIDADYCWMGDYCMPAGSECPAPAGV